MHRKPPDSLLRELQEVAQEARRLHDAVQGSNTLPEAFPKGAVLDICTALAALPEGTGEGCRVPLEYARLRLPAVRREHLEQEDAHSAEADFDQPPPLVRGMGLDRQLRDLIGSVTTALDEYRRLADEPWDDRIQAEPEIEAAAIPAIPAAIDRSIAVEGRLGQTADEIGRLTRPGSVKADRLGRAVRDAAGLTRLARAELRMPTIVIRWYQALTAALADYPALIQKAAGGIEIGVDVAQPVWQRWNDFWGNAETFVFGEVRAMADMLRDIGTRLEQRRAARRAGSGGEADDEAWREAEWRARELILAGEPVPPEIARLVRRLDLSGTIDLPNRLPRPELLGTLPRLQELTLRLMVMDDLSPLAGLVGLISLTLFANRATDLSPLAGLVGLTSLSLSADNATDLSPLAGLVDLISLELSAGSATDLSPLAGLGGLTSLRLSANRATDLSPLAGLGGLTSLRLSANRATDLSPLTGLVGLTSLVLYADSATDLSPLTDLVALTLLGLHANRATDLSPLAKLVDLEELRLASLGIRRRRSATDILDLPDESESPSRSTIDLSPLGRLRKLRKLVVDDVAVADWAPVAHVRQVERR